MLFYCGTSWAFHIIIMSVSTIVQYLVCPVFAFVCSFYSKCSQLEVTGKCSRAVVAFELSVPPINNKTNAEISSESRHEKPAFCI